MQSSSLLLICFQLSIGLNEVLLYCLRAAWEDYSCLPAAAGKLDCTSPMSHHSTCEGLLGGKCSLALPLKLFHLLLSIRAGHLLLPGRSVFPNVQQTSALVAGKAVIPLWPNLLIRIINCRATE